MARELRTRIPLLSMLALALVCCSSCIHIDVGDAMVRFEKEVPLSAALEPGSSFSADTADGSITLEGTQTSECRLDATVVTHAATMERAEELAGQIDVRLEPAGEGLRVVIDRPPVIRNAWFSVSLRGEIPAQTNLTLTTSDGSIHVANTVGILEARTSDGSIETRDTDGDTKLKTSDGSVACTRLKAQTFECRTSDGGIRLSDVTAASLTTSTSDGSITLENVRADTADVRTTDGAIRWYNAMAARADCHSSDGAIHIEYAPDAPKALNISATASDGSITLVTPPGLSAAIDAGTNDGSIHTDLPVTIRGKVGKSLHGTIGDGEGKVYLRTLNGSITIR